MQQKFNENHNKIIPVTTENKPIGKQVHEMIQVLSDARERRCHDFYSPRFIIVQTVGLFLVVGSIAMLIAQARIMDPDLNPRFDLEAQRDKLNLNFFRHWSTTKTNTTQTCREHYPISYFNSICTQQRRIIIEICLELLERYCQNITALNDKIEQSPNPDVSVTLLLFGLIAGGSGIVLSLYMLYEWNRRRTEIPNAYSYIPESHLENLARITSYLNINVDENKSLKNVINLSKTRMDDLRANRCRTLTFFSGLKNPNTFLYSFLKQCDPFVIQLILDYVDPLLVSKNTLCLMRNEKELTEDSPLLAI